jgi:hypothetical protein
MLERKVTDQFFYTLELNYTERSQLSRYRELPLSNLSSSLMCLACLTLARTHCFRLNPERWSIA